MLRVRDLEAFYGASQALFGMELGVDAGEVVTLMGRNGMGKTTTVHAVMGLLETRRGVVEFEGSRVERMASFRIARLGIRHEIWTCLARLKREGQAILVIDKNVGALIGLADRHYIVEKGRVVWTGSSTDLAGDKELQHRYLGV